MITLTHRPSLTQFKGSKDIPTNKPNPSKQSTIDTGVSSSADGKKDSGRDSYVQKWQPRIPIQVRKATQDTFNSNFTLSSSPKPTGHLELPPENPDETLETRLGFMKNWLQSQSPAASETTTEKPQKARPVLQNPASFIGNALAGGSKPDADRQAKVKALKKLAKDNGNQNR